MILNFWILEEFKRIRIWKDEEYLMKFLDSGSLGINKSLNHANKKFNKNVGEQWTAIEFLIVYKDLIKAEIRNDTMYVASDGEINDQEVLEIF